MSRIEVLSGPERRRRWSAEQKRSIIAEAFAPGATVCEVAGRRDIVPGQIYRWRRDLRSAAVGFAEVVVAPGPDERSAAGPVVLEIELGGNIRVRTAAAAPKELASAIIKTLVARRSRCRAGFGYGSRLATPTCGVGCRVWRSRCRRY